MEVINIVVVDDEWLQIRSWLTVLGTECDFSFSGVSEFSVEQVLSKVETQRPSVLLLDIFRAGEEVVGTTEAGIKLFKDLGSAARWKDLQGRVQIVFFSSAPTAIREHSIAKENRLDVAGYLDKKSLRKRNGEAIGVLRAASEQANLYREYPELANTSLRNKCKIMFSPNSIVMRKLWEQIVSASNNWESVLITGATGTGKELVASAIQTLAVERSNTDGILRCGTGKFVSCNIGAMPREGNLQYVELFGAWKGSASNITEDRTGIFLLASESAPQGGTVFLDEIGDAPAIIQVSLLRVLEARVNSRLGAFDKKEGGQTEEKVRFRLISASHKLEDEVRDDNFREDLYHRLSTVRIHVPPLCERKDDIGVLLYHFLGELNDISTEGGYGWDIHIGDEKGLLETLKRYDWPGNVRELEKAIRASYVSSHGKVFQLNGEILERIEQAEARNAAMSEGTMIQAGLPADHSPKQAADASAASGTAPEVAAKDTSNTIEASPSRIDSTSALFDLPNSISNSLTKSNRSRVNCRGLWLNPGILMAELATILENLGEADPRPNLPDLEAVFGLPAIIGLYQLLAARIDEKYLDADSAMKYFGTTEEAARKWFTRAKNNRLPKLAGPARPREDQVSRRSVSAAAEHLTQEDQK